jgi:hypothetical protein
MSLYNFYFFLIVVSLFNNSIQLFVQIWIIHFTSESKLKELILLLLYEYFVLQKYTIKANKLFFDTIHWTQYTKWWQTKQKICTQHIKLKIWATQISQKNEVNSGAHQAEGQVCVSLLSILDCLFHFLYCLCLSIVHSWLSLPFSLLLVSLYCPFLIVSSIFSNVYKLVKCHCSCFSGIHHTYIYSLVSYLFIKQDQMILICNSDIASLMLSEKQWQNHMSERRENTVFSKTSYIFWIPVFKIYQCYVPSINFLAGQNSL